MAGYWFKAKTYGWGWTPCRWQGWVVLIGYCAAVAGSAVVFLRPNLLPDAGKRGWIEYLAGVALETVLLLVICLRTGEKPAWRWGPEKR